MLTNIALFIIAISLRNDVAIYKNALRLVQ